VRKVVSYLMTSIDGVVEEPGDWVFDVDEAIFANLERVISRQETVLLGHRTWDYWVDYWPTADMQPFADFINGTDKHVFASTPVRGEWSASTVVTGPAEAHVAALREGDGGDIGIHGSIALTRSLLRAGLVDKLRLVVAPTVAGRGLRLP
jgi:dihydrofolate reductase